MSAAIEICVDTAGCASAAAHAGADRIELCSALGLGGLTPSAGLMAAAAALPVPVRALIRPRDGDFRYDAADLAVMDDDITRAREAGLEGVVIGALTAENALDLTALERLAATAEGMGLTLHRAFDMCADPFDALEQAIALGFDHILTSGQALTVAEGIGRIAELTDRAGDRITIMPGGGVRPDGAADLLARSGVRAIHASCASGQPDAALAAFGFAPAEGPRRFDPAVFAALRAAVDADPLETQPLGDVA